MQRFAVENLSAADLETLRLILTSESVIDWKRLHFAGIADVDQFLRANLFDPADPGDEARLRAILAQAVDYLRRTFRYKVTEAVAHPRHVRDLFLYASGVEGTPSLRRIACVVLKVMHTVHHIEARELLHRTRMSEAELGELVDARVRSAVAHLRDVGGLPILSFDGNAKTRQSVITKLLSKRENVAAQVYDRHRYRVVVSDESSLVAVVLGLAHQLFPFNYVVPGQTQNTLVSPTALLARHPVLAPLAGHLIDPHDEPPAHASNEFSGRSYRVLNFIVDLPLRIDAQRIVRSGSDDRELGRIIFSPVELQVVDAVTAQANEQGDNSHARYKKRQLRRVLGRLSRGLVVPRRRRTADTPST